MNHKQKIVEFLVKPENLPVTLEVANHIEEVRQMLNQSFWTDFKRALQTNLNQSSLRNRWVVGFDGDYGADGIFCWIQNKHLAENFTCYNLFLGIEEWSKGGYSVGYGMAWNKEIKNETDKKVIQRSYRLESYKRLLQKSDNVEDPAEENLPYWPRYYLLDLDFRGDDFALEYGLDRSGYVRDLANKIWVYFKTIEPELYRFNQEMMRLKK
jgi:hypothetical protein